MELRPYQVQAVKAIHKEWNKGHKKTVLVLPTGTGKTIVFSKVVEDEVKKGGRALILAHRNELLNQAADKLFKSCGLSVAIEKAKMTSIGSEELVTLGSVQTLSREARLNCFKPDYFKTIIVDEGHHAMSDSYQKILNYFKGSNILAVTATPDRGDQKNLGQFFDSKAYEYSLHQAVKDGYLSPVRAQMIPLKLDISKVHISNGDYSVGEIGTSLEPYLESIADEMLKYCKGRKTVVFLPLIKTSQTFCKILKKRGFKAVEVNGESEDRDKILQKFEKGKYEVICNSMLLTEGWDCPSVDAIVILRPTKVRSLYQQMVGRGMRLSPGKKDLLLLDFLWATSQMDLCHPSALLSRNDEIAERINKMVEEGEGGVDLLKAEEKAEKDIVEARERALAKRLEAMRKMKSHYVDPLQYIFSIEAEDLSDYSPTFKWESGPMTEAQKKCLLELDIDPSSITSCGQASALITRLIQRKKSGLATPRQVRLLESFGFLHVGTWSFKNAFKIISQISNNGWNLPKNIIPTKFSPVG